MVTVALKGVRKKKCRIRSRKMSENRETLRLNKAAGNFMYFTPYPAFASVVGSRFLLLAVPWHKGNCRIFCFSDLSLLPTVKHLDLCPSTAKGEINYFRVVLILWLLTKQTDKIKETTNIWKKKIMENTPKISKVPKNLKKRKMRYKSDEIICFVQFM